VHFLLTNHHRSAISVLYTDNTTNGGTMEELDSMISQVVSGIHQTGIPYPSKAVTLLEPISDTHHLLGPPLVEISAYTENGVGGSKYELLVSNVIYSQMMDSYWFVYGFIYETLTTGKPEDIQVLAFRWFQKRGYITPFRLWSCQYLEGKRLNVDEIKEAIKNIPAITQYKFIN